MNRLRNKKGFTLVELIVVLIILVILAAILIPSLTGYIDRSKDKKYILAARNVETAAKTMYMETYAETGYKIVGIKWNYTSNFQKTPGGGHYCQPEALFVYSKSGANGYTTLGKWDPTTIKSFNTMMNLVETGDIYLSRTGGTTWIFFDQNGRITSKLRGQGAVTQLPFADKDKSNPKKVIYDDTKGWYVE